MERHLRKKISDRFKKFKKWEAALLVLVVVLLFLGIVYYAEADRLQFERMLKIVQGELAQAGSDASIGAQEGIAPVFQDFLVGREVESIEGAFLSGSARRKGCDYFLADREIPKEELESTGYRLVSKKGDYHFYVSEIKAGEWRITQYGTVSGLQSMCYSLVSHDGDFVLIDGGHEADRENLRKLIEVFEDRVDVWICSHFHDDHIGAITAMLPDLGKLTIEEIWCPPMDIETYKTFAKEWDCVDTCDAFLKEIEGMSNVSRVEIGETRSVAGLTFEFLSAYREDAPWTHEGNNCGFFFQVKGEKETMLFCCDIGNEWISDCLVNSYGERLKSDYVQMGHHGNGGLTEEAYRIVAPRAAFFDCPAWVFADEEKYTATQNRKLMESIGCTIYVMDEAPNSIILR